MLFMITCRIPVEKGNELAKVASLHSKVALHRSVGQPPTMAFLSGV